MKYLVPILLPLMLACGEECKTPDLSNNPIVWQGKADQYENDLLTKAIDETRSCLANINPEIVKNYSDPDIVITQNLIFDSLAGHCSLCQNTIYVSEGNLYKTNIEYIDGFFIGTPDYRTIGMIFREETVHYVTGLGNEAHNTIYFSCAVVP